MLKSPRRASLFLFSKTYKPFVLNPNLYLLVIQHSYWPWPSRNSEFPHETMCVNLSIVFCMLTRTGNPGASINAACLLGRSALYCATWSCSANGRVVPNHTWIHGGEIWEKSQGSLEFRVYNEIVFFFCLSPFWIEVRKPKGWWFVDGQNWGVNLLNCQNWGIHSMLDGDEKSCGDYDQQDPAGFGYFLDQLMACRHQLHAEQNGWWGCRPCRPHLKELKHRVGRDLT